jgi:heme-degrading monooxygenase HmoA
MGYYQVEPERTSDAEAAFRVAGSEIAELDGFVRGVILADEESGTIVTLTLWESHAAMEASEVRAASLRQRAVKAGEGGVVRVERYAVVTEL